MKVKVITYDGMAQRLSTVQQLLSELATQGLTAQVVHESHSSANDLQYVLVTQTMSAYTLSFTPVDADCLVLVDGDLVGPRTVRRLEELGKPVYLIAPQAALPGVQQEMSIDEVLRLGKMYPPLSYDDEYPRTFACHHKAETCFSCAWLVAQWKADRRTSEAQRVENLRQVDLATLGAVVAYPRADGQRDTGTYSGEAKLVWAKFPYDTIPANQSLIALRGDMLAAYEPVGIKPPAGLFACTCFVVHND